MRTSLAFRCKFGRGWRQGSAASKAARDGAAVTGSMMVVTTTTGAGGCRRAVTLFTARGAADRSNRATPGTARQE